MRAVEIGAGHRRRHGYAITVDLAGTPDVRADALALPFATASVDAIEAIDVLEHLSYRDTGKALAEWARVCKPHANIYLQVPDGRTLVEWYVRNPEHLMRGYIPDGIDPTPRGVLEWKLLGGQGDGRYASAEEWRYNAHYAIFDEPYLRRVLDEAGFDVVALTTNGHPNFLCDARRR